MNPLVERFRACGTTADFYRLQILIENNAPPGDILALWHERHLLPEQALQWLMKLRDMMFVETPALQRFRLRKIADNVSLYSARQSPGEPRDLVIAFCGLADRLQLPIPVVCQHLDGGRFDILLVRDTSKRIYLEGVPGYAPSLALVAERLRSDLDLAGYRSVCCLGTSGGGWASLLVGAMLGVERAVSVAGKPPGYTAKLERAWSQLGFSTEPQHVDFGAFERFFAEAPVIATRLFAIFGADHAADREGAQDFRRIAGAATIGLQGIADHNVMLDMLKRRRLATFLTQCLGGNLEEIVPASGETMIQIDMIPSPASAPAQ